MTLYEGAILTLGIGAVISLGSLISYLRFRNGGMKKLLLILDFYKRERLEEHALPEPKVADDV